MNKILLEDTEQLNQISCSENPVLIFKHSTRCPISSMALNRIEGSKQLKEMPFDYYFLDLIRFREISNLVAETFSVAHESPQILIIKNGDCVLDASHNAINADEIAQMLA